MKQTYDIGIHRIADKTDEANTHLEDITKKVTDAGGEVISHTEGEPMKLSYEIRGKGMSKEGVYPRHTKSMFFTMLVSLEEVSAVEAINTMLEESNKVIRHMVVAVKQEPVLIDRTLYVSKEKMEEEGKKAEKEKADKNRDDDVVDTFTGEEDEEGGKKESKMSKEKNETEE